MIINYNNAYFLTSSVHAKCMHVKQHGIEIGLIGYSNSGKSTLINCLTRNKLSRCSRYPGRTNMINFFSINKNLRLVDLPGYGYSTICSKKKKNHSLIFNYIKYRMCLKGIFLLVDIRRLLREEDFKILKFSKKNCIKIIILLAKCDKLSFSKQKMQFQNMVKLIDIYKDIPLILFSSFKYTGLQYIRNTIELWFNEYMCY